MVQLFLAKKKRMVSRSPVEALPWWCQLFRQTWKLFLDESTDAQTFQHNTIILKKNSYLKCT